MANKYTPKRAFDALRNLTSHGYVIKFDRYGMMLNGEYCDGDSIIQQLVDTEEKLRNKWDKKNES